MGWNKNLTQYNTTQTHDTSFAVAQHSLVQSWCNFRQLNYLICAKRLLNVRVHVGKSATPSTGYFELNQYFVMSCRPYMGWNLNYKQMVLNIKIAVYWFNYDLLILSWYSIITNQSLINQPGTHTDEEKNYNSHINDGGLFNYKIQASPQVSYTVRKRTGKCIIVAYLVPTF